MNRKYLLCWMSAIIVMFCGIASAAEKVIEWKFDGNLNDSSGNGLNANPFPDAPSMVYGTGVSGQALVSDGNECTYLTGIDTAVLPVLAADTWSVNLWVYPTEIPKDWRLAWCLGEKPYNISASSRTLYASGGGNISFANPQASGYVYTVSTIPWDINQWQMVTTTYDGSIVRIYKNGVLIAMRDQTFSDSPGEVRVPSYAWDSKDFFAGRFDEFTVWRGVLSVDDILDLVIPGAIPAVELNQQVVYYQMGDITPSAMPDHSGNANDGTLYGYTLPISNWVADGFRGDSLLFEGGQSVKPPVAISQPVNYTVAFWFKSGHQDYRSAFYSEKYSTDGTQLSIRANNDELQVESKDKYYTPAFSFAADASAYLDGVTWNHLAVVADGEAAKATLYINGEFLADDDYIVSSHKTPGMAAAIGYGYNGQHFLGEWNSTYVDEVKTWNGALTPAQIQAVAARTNFGNDLKVNLEDFAPMADEWQLDYEISPGSVYVADDMEGTLTGWSVYSSSTYSGTGTISQTTNAYAGSNALRWEYSLPAPVAPATDNYTNIVFDLGSAQNLSVYDGLSLWLYRHTGNTAEDLLYLKFYDDGVLSDPNNLKAEVWITGDASVTDPVDEWDEWTIDTDPNLLLGPYGADTTDPNALKSVRYLLIGTGSSDRTDARTGTIDVDDVTFIVDPVCSGRPETDVNFDCRVDIQDLQAISEEWLFGTE